MQRIKKKPITTRLGRYTMRGFGLIALAGLLGFGSLCWRIDRQGRTDEARPAERQGIPAEALRLADGSWDTQADARFAAEVMEAHGWHTALVVTHPLHTYRTRYFFRRAGIDAYTSPTTTNLSAIRQPWRIYYTVREAAGVLWPLPESAGLPQKWTARLQRWVYTGP